MTQADRVYKKATSLFAKELRAANKKARTKKERRPMTQRVSYIGGLRPNTGVKTAVLWLKNGEVEVASIRPAKEILEQDALARKVMGQKLMWYGAFDKNHYGAVYQQ